MQNLDGRLILSPSDLSAFLECEHKSTLELQRCLEDAAIERSESPEAEILKQHGLDHERAWLDKLVSEGREITHIPSARDGWNAAVAATAKAMKAGAEVIYQGAFLDGDWRGVADFLVRVAEPSELGNWNYEAWDTKLARKTKPAYVFQLAFYSEQIQKVSGRLPEQMHVVVGTNVTESLATNDFLAYYRSVRARFSRFTIDRPITQPLPVPACGQCAFQANCDALWRREDHLSLVAGMRRSQIETLTAASISTLRTLAETTAVPDTTMAVPIFETLRHQARLQLGFRDTGAHSYELIPPAGERGFELIPPPSPGDLFFDMEGDPYFESSGGLEYLFGVCWRENGALVYRAWWAITREQEASAFRAFIDFLRDRLKADPALHVYHYASYERTKLGQLAQQHSTREEELDDLLRRDLFVDLYPVVRQSVRTSHEGYSLKDMRQFFMTQAGQGSVTTALDSIVEFENWRTTGDEALLFAIERYNEEDCVSTAYLRDWLLDRKSEAERQFGLSIRWRAIPTQANEPVTDPEDTNAALRTSLLAHSEESEPMRTVAGLLDYHRREDKPEWWAYFDRFESTTSELLDDVEAIADLLGTGEVIAPQGRARSPIHTLAFPAQEYNFSPGDKVIDFSTHEDAGEIFSIDHQNRRLLLKRGPKLSAVTLPRAIVAGKPYGSREQREAVRRVAEQFNGHGIASSARWTAIADLLLKRRPRLRSGHADLSLQTLDLVEQTNLVRALDNSCLIVQGPPGSGKTWTGARLAASLIGLGHRVGVAAFSHRAIHTFLAELELAASEQRLSFMRVKKSTKGREDSHFVSRNIRSEDDLNDCLDGSIQLLAGTSYCFSPAVMDEAFDYVFVDEAGQLSLGDTVAIATACRNLVLLGDPQQLPQVSHGVHATGVGVSALDYFMGTSSVVGSDRGLFLGRTYRMHPDLCNFVSALSYEGKLLADDSCAVQGVTSAAFSGNGTRFVPVAHSGNAQMSREEALVVSAEVDRLLATGRFTNSKGVERALVPSDILVITPYNMQVRCLREHLPAGVEAGTVDKFQGREAAVVFFSMASSTGDDVPHGREFLFSKNRLNVALSRARCLSIVVASPALLQVDCRSVDDMRLVNALCRLAEESAQEAVCGLIATKRP